MKLESEIWADERRQVRRRQVKPTLAERITRAWFSPRIEAIRPAGDPDMFRWWSIEELLDRQR